MTMADNKVRERPTFGRYAEIPYDQMTPTQQKAYQILAQVEGDGKPELPGPLKIWVENANLAKAVAPLATYFRPSHHSLTQREREIAVCVIVGKWHAAFAIDAHTNILVGLGVSPEIVAALATGGPTSFTDPREEMIYELAIALSDARWIPQSLYERAVDVLGMERITDAIVLMGLYTAVALTLAFYDVPSGAAGIKR